MTLLDALVAFLRRPRGKQPFRIAIEGVLDEECQKLRILFNVGVSCGDCRVFVADALGARECAFCAILRRAAIAAAAAARRPVERDLRRVRAGRRQVPTGSLPEDA